jgi:hypothetical protein
MSKFLKIFGIFRNFDWFKLNVKYSVQIKFDGQWNGMQLFGWRRNARHAELIKMRHCHHREKKRWNRRRGNRRKERRLFWADEISRSDDFIKMGLLTERTRRVGSEERAGSIRRRPVTTSRFRCCMQMKRSDNMILVKVCRSAAVTMATFPTLKVPFKFNFLKI